jgi:hypothetical protein
VVNPWSLTGQRAAGVAWRQTRDRTRERVPDTMPRVRLIAHTEVSKDAARELRTIDMSRVALVSRPLALSGGEPGDARLLADRPGRIVVDVTTAGAALLVTTEAWDTGWRATDETGPLGSSVNATSWGDRVRRRSRVTLVRLPGLRAAPGSRTPCCWPARASRVALSSSGVTAGCGRLVLVWHIRSR